MYTGHMFGLWLMIGRAVLVVGMLRSLEEFAGNARAQVAMHAGTRSRTIAVHNCTPAIALLGWQMRVYLFCTFRLCTCEMRSTEQEEMSFRSIGKMHKSIVKKAVNALARSMFYDTF